MVLEARLPEKLGADAVATVVYILNRSPSKVRTGKTSYEAWFGRQPNLSHLHRFRCDTNLHVPDAQSTKLKPKTRLCMFLGYVPNTTKQCRMCNGCHHHIVIGVNVRFDDNGFGNWQYEDPKRLQEILEDQTDQLIPLAPLRNRITVETPPGEPTPSSQMPAVNGPDTRYHSQQADEAPDRESSLTSLSLSPLPTPQSQYLNPITSASQRSEAGYKDTISMAPQPEVNVASG